MAKASKDCHKSQCMERGATDDSLISRGPVLKTPDTFELTVKWSWHNDISRSQSMLFEAKSLTQSKSLALKAILQRCRIPPVKICRPADKNTQNIYKTPPTSNKFDSHHIVRHHSHPFCWRRANFHLQEKILMLFKNQSFHVSSLSSLEPLRLPRGSGAHEFEPEFH